MRTVRSARSGTRRPAVPAGRTTGRRAGRTALLLTGALVLAGCAAPALPADTGAPPQVAPTAPATLAADSCPNPRQSYDPLPATSGDPAFPAGSLQAEIRKRGRLVVGVSGDSLLLGARDPADPKKFEGFDIDLARAVARAIFGAGGESKVQFRVITAAQRIELVNAGAADRGVDLVARNMTMNCERWEQVGFSAVYFVADQRVLVRKDATARSGAELGAAKARVCAPRGSTSISRIAHAEAYSGVVPVEVDQHTTCLALLQQGRVDAITGDSTVLAGLKAQDPKFVEVLPGSLGAEPYGLAVAKDHPEFARYVNAVLARYVADGSWQASYDKYFASALQAGSPPTPQYGRPLP
jgi:polar amino acid transport system substrate-binding protein